MKLFFYIFTLYFKALYVFDVTVPFALRKVLAFEARTYEPNSKDHSFIATRQQPNNKQP